MNLSPYEFEKAPEGSLFIKKNKKLVAVTSDELLKPLKDELYKYAELESKVNDLVKCTKHFKTLAKSHFIVVFSAFKTKVMTGEIVIEDENLLKLDESVLKNELTVVEALSKHEYLAETFNALFNEDAETIEFPYI